MLIFQICITYWSLKNHTATMATGVFEGCEKYRVAGHSNVSCIKQPIEMMNIEILNKCHGIILGSPVYNGGLAPKVEEFIATWPWYGAPWKKCVTMVVVVMMYSKVGAAFVTAGGISLGEEFAMQRILQAMMVANMITVGGVQDSTENYQSTGASAITSEHPWENGKVDEMFLKKATSLGYRVATVVDALNL